MRPPGVKPVDEWRAVDKLAPCQVGPPSLAANEEPGKRAAEVTERARRIATSRKAFNNMMAALDQPECHLSWLNKGPSATRRRWMARIRKEELSNHHDRAAFDCGVELLNSSFRRQRDKKTSGNWSAPRCWSTSIGQSAFWPTARPCPARSRHPPPASRHWRKSPHPDPSCGSTGWLRT